MPVKPINFDLHKERLTYLDARIARFKAEMKKAEESLLNEIKALKMHVLGHSQDKEFGLWNLLEKDLFQFNFEAHPLSKSAKAYLEKSKNLIHKFEDLIALHNIELYQGQLHGDKKLFEDLVDKAIYDDLLSMYKQLIAETEEYIVAEKEERKAPAQVNPDAKATEEAMVKWFEYFDSFLIEYMEKKNVKFEELTNQMLGSFVGGVKSNMLTQKVEFDPHLYDRWVFETKNKLNKAVAKKKGLQGSLAAAPIPPETA